MGRDWQENQEFKVSLGCVANITRDPVKQAGKEGRGLRISEAKPFGLSVRVFPGSVDLEGKTHPECGWPHPAVWGLH